MKNHFILFLLALCTQPVFAQKFSYGLRGGMNYNIWHELHNDYIFNHSVEPEMGIELGLVARQKLINNIYINEELLYIHRNSSTKNKVTGERFVVMKNDFVAVPIYISYRFFGALHLDLGGQYSHIVNCKSTKYSSPYLNTNELESLNLISAFIGLGYKPSKKINIDCRYIHTFNQISKYYFTDHNASVLSYQTESPRTFSLAIGYNF